MFRLYLLFFISLLASSLTHSIYSGSYENMNPDRPSTENVEQAKRDIQKAFHTTILKDVPYSARALSHYSHLDPKREVPKKLLTKAVLFFDQNKKAFENKEYISIVDFSMESNQPRFFIINMNSGEVIKVRTAHGAGGDLDDDGFVEQLSNTSNSHMSSKGYYKVSETYYGRFGRSIRLDGLSQSNSRVRPRAIVIHGHKGMSESFDKQSLSWGCFMLALSIRDSIIDKIYGGSLLYAEKSLDL